MSLCPDGQQANLVFFDINDQEVTIENISNYEEKIVNKIVSGYQATITHKSGALGASPGYQQTIYWELFNAVESFKNYTYSGEQYSYYQGYEAFFQKGALVQMKDPYGDFNNYSPDQQRQCQRWLDDPGWSETGIILYPSIDEYVTIDSVTKYSEYQASGTKADPNYTPILKYIGLGKYELRVFDIDGNLSFISQKDTSHNPSLICIGDTDQCPENTCEVDCGTHICCYGSDGVAVHSFVKP